MRERRKVSIEEAVSLAQTAQRQGRFDEAEGIYSQILQGLPRQEDALHFLGVLRYQQGRTDEAIDLIQQAVAAAPGYADAYNNLGNVFEKSGRLREAADAYRKVLTLKPDHADACNNLGIVLKQARHPQEAEEAFRQCLGLDQGHISARRNLANLLRRSGRPEEAGAHYRELLKLAPDNPVFSYLSQVCDPGQGPERAPDDYVKAEFDAFAAEFDEKLAVLGYRAPQLIDELLFQRLGPPAGGLDVLDAGCGTGLCGPLLAPRARRLVGADIAPKMLDKAREREVYDKLALAEITAYMERRCGCFDLIVGADTLCYFGAMESVLSAAAKALRPGGFLTFTTEQAEGRDSDAGRFELKPTGRYGHSRDYLRRTLEAASLDAERIDDAILREESGKPVAGFLVLARKGPSPDR